MPRPCSQGEPMPERQRHAVDATDEQLHTPDTEALWNESYYLDFVSEDGSVGGYARIGFYPNLGVTWWTTMVVGPDRPMVASVSYDLPPLAGTGVSIDADGHSISCVAGDPLQQMSLRATAPAAIHDDAAASYHGDAGQPTTLAMDLTWTTDGTPVSYTHLRAHETRHDLVCRL